MITQLRDVRAARQSAKVAMKNHQEPVSPVVIETVNFAVAVPKVERHGGFSRQISMGIQSGHGMLLRDGLDAVSLSI